MIAKGAVVVTRLAPLRFPFASPFKGFTEFTLRDTIAAILDYPHMYLGMG